MRTTTKNASASKASKAQDTNKTNANNAPAPAAGNEDGQFRLIQDVTITTITLK